MGRSLYTLRRLSSLLLLAIVLLTALPAPLIQAQEASPPAEIPTETVTPVATATPTEPSTATPPPTATDIPLATPTSTAVAPIVIEPTATPSPTISDTNQAESLSTGAQVVVHLGDVAGPVLSGICATLFSRDQHDWNSTDCSNSSGEMFLPVLIPSTGPKQYLIEVKNTPGYAMPPGQEFVATLPYGTVDTYNIWVVAQTVGTETLKAVDALSGDPVGGACWSYLQNGSTVLGPICDTDNDGTVVIADIVADAYCLVATPPSGYDMVGTEPICAGQQIRNGTYTKLFVSQLQGGGASIHITALAPWGKPVADVCVQVSAPIGGNPTDFSIGCTAADGQITIHGLLTGTYTLSAHGMPAAFNSWAPITVAAVGSTTVDQTINLVISPAGDIAMTSVLYFGPQTLPGACYSYTTNVDGKPGPDTVLGPVCDTDGDGITTLTGVPRGPFCVVVTSAPAGYYRQNNDGYACDNDLRGGKGAVGFSPIPTPTPIPASPTRTNTPRPTATPYPTPTTIPSPPPAGNEPNSGLLTKNCSYYDTDTFPYYAECVAGPAGVRLQVIQNGFVVQTITTGANGSALINLPNRQAYTLHYLNGNGTWVSGSGEESRARYDSSDTFYFLADPSVPHLWKMTVTTNYSASGNFPGQPIGGVCAKIVGHDGLTYVPVTCDTDNDGVIDFGYLPARYWAIDLSFYSAVMTQAPAGLPVRSDTVIGYLTGLPTDTWNAGWTYLGTHQIQVRAEDQDGKLVQGGCYRFVYNTSPNPITEDYIDSFSGFAQHATGNTVPDGTSVTITPRCSIAGYTVDFTPKTITLPATFLTTVAFSVQKYGTETADTARVRITVINGQTEFASNDSPTHFTNDRTGQLCLTLTPNPGTPSTSACVDSFRTRNAVFTNLPVGTYSIGEAVNTSGCTGKYPSTTFSITDSDLGAEKRVRYVVRCDNDVNSCIAFQNHPGRDINVYYGTMYDKDGNPVGTNLVVSESIPQFLLDGLQYLTLPDPALVNIAALNSWTVPYSPNSTLVPWETLPDYDNNAQQILTNMWLKTANAAVDAPVDRGSLLASGSPTTDFLLGPLTPQEKAQFPECAYLSPSGFGTVLGSYQNNVHFYRLDAHIVPPTATATATVTSTPTATAIPSPAAVCSTTTDRDLTAYYGVLRDEKGKVISNNLALSDHIPAALSEAIKHASSPGKIKQLIDRWIDTGLVEEAWAGSPGINLDPATYLEDKYGEQASAYTLGDAQDLGTETYTFTTYVLVDSHSVPAGCILPADFESAALGLLIPVEQTTSVTIHYIGQDATAHGQILPTATNTPAPTSTGTPEQTATTTPEPSTTEVPATEAPATLAPTDPSTTPKPVESPTAAVTTLPNTGAHPTGSEASHLWLMLLALLLSLLGTAWTIRFRHKVR